MLNCCSFFLSTVHEVKVHTKKITFNNKTIIIKLPLQRSAAYKCDIPLSTPYLRDFLLKFLTTNYLNEQQQNNEKKIIFS